MENFCNMYIFYKYIVITLILSRVNIQLVNFKNIAFYAYLNKSGVSVFSFTAN